MTFFRLDAGSTTMAFSADDYRLMARTFRLRAADETRADEIDRLHQAARRYERLAREDDALSAAAAPKRHGFPLTAMRFGP
jgi:hypothetical protein